MFRVQTGTVETVVEGTRFVVRGSETVAVRVDEGRVRVVNGDAEAVVAREDKSRCPWATSSPAPPSR